jgi:adenosylmethionine-8-amino-7-oxononanoate aminotransferase
MKTRDRVSSEQLIHGFTEPNSYDLGIMRYPKFVKGEGAHLYDENGKLYLDAKSSMFNVALGHGIFDIINTAVAQLKNLAYCPTMDGHTNSQAEELAKILVSKAPKGLSDCYLSTTGTSACEVAAEMSLAFWGIRGEPHKKMFIVLDKAYHGTSLFTATLSSDSKIRELLAFGVENVRSIVSPYCYRCPFASDRSDCEIRCADELEKAIIEEGETRIAGFFLEPVLASAVIIPPKMYFRKLADIVESHDILLICDEVLTGFGRLGYMFASDFFEISPHIMCLGKAINNGVLPLAATLFSRSIYSEFEKKNQQIPFGSTQDGNPVCAATGISASTYYNDELFKNVRRIGTYLLDFLNEGLEETEIIGDIRGMGLLIGIELVQNKSNKQRLECRDDLLKAFLRERLLVHLEDNMVVIAPPLIIDFSVAEQIATRLIKVLKQIDSRKKKLR